MLQTLSSQEREAILEYNRLVRQKQTQDQDLTASSFMVNMFAEHQGSVIDIGCGLGRMVNDCHNFGISSYLGIDPAIQHIKYCCVHFPAVPFMHASTEQLQSVQEQHGVLGGFVLLNVLCHVPKKRIGRTLDNIRKSVRVGSVGLLNVLKPTAIISRARSQTFTQYETAKMNQILIKAGFTINSLEDDGHSVLYKVIAT